MASLSFFVAGYVVSLEKPCQAIEMLIEKHGLGPFLVKILCDILVLEKRTGHDEPSVGYELRYLIQDTFLANVTESASVREYLASPESSLLWSASGGARISAIVDRLLRFLLNSTDQNCTRSAEVDDVMLSSIITMTKVYLSDGTVTYVLRQLTTFINEESIPDDAKQRQHRIDIVTMIGAKWQEDFLGQLSTPESHFGDLILASAQEVFMNPSSTDALSIFGNILGKEMPDFVYSTKHAQSRIHLALHLLLRLCSKELEARFNDNDSTIFQRLAPLLLLRRIPRQYVVMARTATNTQGRMNGVQKWTDILASRLVRILESTDNPGSTTAHERRLAAEVAGRLLKFGSDSSSTFQLVCSPCFSKIVRKSIDNVLGSDDIEPIQKARLALYTACYSMQPGEDISEDNSNEELCSVASFALYVLGMDMDETNDTVRRELEQLQTGCIEFLAICVSSLYQAPRRNNKERNEPTLFGRIYGGIQNVLKNGYPDSNDEWILEGISNFSSSAKAVCRNVRDQAQISLWNVLSLVAQRLDTTDGSLESFASSNFWIAEWIQKDRHDLVMAAAMQTMFITLARLKNLSCFGDNDYGRVASVLHVRAFEILQSNSMKADSCRTTLRVAALKLVLCLTSLHRHNQLLPESPPRLHATYDVIEQLARTDPSSEIRALSMQILRIF